MLRPYFADLHIHTVVSPCGEVEMIPPLIVRRAKEVGLDLIAVTDHNCADNVGAVIEAAADSGIAVLPGMEVQTREEVHLLCLFDTIQQVMRWQRVVYEALPSRKNPAEVFGPQFVVDATGEFIRHNERLLLTSTSLSVEQVVEGVNREGGLCIAAHVDRPSYSLLVSLGFIPSGLDLAALEVSPRITVEEAKERFPQISGWPLIVSSDAHRLDEMNAYTMLILEEPSIAEIRMAFAAQGGRGVRILNPN